MATQSSIIDTLLFQLVLTDAMAPSTKYPDAHAPDQNEEGTHGGCSVCPSEEYFSETDMAVLVTIILAQTGPDPTGLEVMVLDTSRPDGPRYAPRQGALADLARTRRARWTLPPGAARPASLVVSFGFADATGRMVHLDRQALDR